MNAVRVYAPNSGQFHKGSTPWNKDTGKGGRKDAKKGVRGYQPKEVVAINPDGTVYKRFKSVEAAKDFFGLRDRHSITHACKGLSLCRGFRLFYGEDYIPWGDYRYPRRRSRDIYGRLLPGHHCTGFRKPSEEQRKEKAERVRKQSFRMAHDPNSKWGKGGNMIPVICVETGEKFPSLKAASGHFNIGHSQISMAVRRGGKCHGMTFKKLAEFDEDKSKEDTINTTSM